MNTHKKAAFLVYVENSAELETILQAIEQLSVAICCKSLREERATLKSNYIIIDVTGKNATWGGNDLRPFGHYTPKYAPITGGAMKAAAFVEVCKILVEGNIPSKEYVVPATAKTLSVIARDGYEILHRPYFAMHGSTHELYTINPLTQRGVDAGKADAESMTQDEFFRLYRGAKTDVASFLNENFTPLSDPVNGFAFITGKGQFIDVSERDHDYNSLIDELEKQNYDVDTDRRRISDLEKKGYIYCDTGMENGYPYYPYLILFKQPTQQQFEALRLWIGRLSRRTKLEVICEQSRESKRFMTDRTPVEKIFKYINDHAGDSCGTGSDR